MTGEGLNYNHLDDSERVLADHQERAVRIIEEARQSGISGGYLNWATGVGKTDAAAHSVKSYLEQNPGGKAIVLAHRGYILEHLSESFGDVIKGGSRGHMFGGEFEDRGDVVFASFQAMNRKLGGGKVYEGFDPNEFGMMVIDESHHGPAPTYREVIDYFNGFKLGLTSVPERRDRQDIGEVIGPELDRILLEEAIATAYSLILNTML